ncbi:hypothetical protein C8J56DRAFT_1031635 [Mycena floridula]|nr:hypothetical protein C8J56DRAFT_1031635 [Mycena floridula]
MKEFLGPPLPFAANPPAMTFENPGTEVIILPIYKDILVQFAYRWYTDYTGTRVAEFLDKDLNPITLSNEYIVRPFGPAPGYVTAPEGQFLRHYLIDGDFEELVLLDRKMKILGRVPLPQWKLKLLDAQAAFDALNPDESKKMYFLRSVEATLRMAGQLDLPERRTDFYRFVGQHTRQPFSELMERF